MGSKKLRFGIIGLGLMGREFASSIARWCHLLDDLPEPEIIGICSGHNTESWKWYHDHFPSIKIATLDYHELLGTPDIDVVYCAVPHNLHEKIYIDILKSGKHLFGEKPFGIDQKANKKILEEINRHPGLVVRCTSEFPYFPGAQRLIGWIREKKYGRLMEIKAGFHHSSDMDLNKPINWKRMIEINGEYGSMGDLGMHIQHIPFRMGWKPETVYANLLNIATERPDGKGNTVPCKTWDNAEIICRATDPVTSTEFSIIFETKRMMPGATNTWFLEVYGTEGSAKFTTRDPRVFYFLKMDGNEQGWTRIDLGARSAIPTVTGGIFEFGFSDAFQQMLGAFMYEFTDHPEKHPFRTVTPEETEWSHKVLTAALQSDKEKKQISI